MLQLNSPMIGLMSRGCSHVASDRAGASVVFTGTTRQVFDGLTTDWLEYEAYEPLAKNLLDCRTRSSSVSNSKMFDRA